MGIGTLYGLGVGPGDPELLTLKALRLLRACPVIAYPAPEEGNSFARSIVAPHLIGNQREIEIRMPLSAERFPAAEAYDRGAEAIAAELRAGNDVAVLCQGDPFLYGSFQYLFARMADNFKVVVVPGVSSITASAAALRMSLAARDDIVTIIPGTLPEDRLEAMLAAADAAAILKLGRHFAKVRTVLDRLGLADRARYIERATLDGQAMTPLASVDPARVPYFSMILVHKRGAAFR